MKVTCCYILIHFKRFILTIQWTKHLWLFCSDGKAKIYLPVQSSYMRAFCLPSIPIVFSCCQLPLDWWHPVSNITNFFREHGVGIIVVIRADVGFFFDSSSRRISLKSHSCCNSLCRLLWCECISKEMWIKIFHLFCFCCRTSIISSLIGENL